MIKLPKQLEENIKKIINLEGLNIKNIDSYSKEIDMIRKKLINLSDDFYLRGFYNEENEIAYLSYNFPMNIAKVMWIMEIIKKFSFISGKINVLDIGCGEGAGSLGVYYTIPENILSIKGIDNSYVRLNLYEKFMKETGLDFKIVDKNILNIEEFEIYESHLILLSNVICEIDLNNIRKFIKKILKIIQDKGILIIIEPALKEGAKNLMRIRDELIKEYFILPCIHKGYCPLLEKEQWCYSVKKWEYPFFMEVINRKLFRDLRLKFSYLVLRKINEEIEDLYFFLGETKEEKGRTKNQFCCESGLKECILLKKDISEKNISFKKIEQGDIVSLKNYSIRSENLIFLNRKTEVKII